MVDVTLNLKPEEIQEALKKAIVDGAIGKQIRKSLEDLEKANNYNFSSAIEGAIKSEVGIVVSNYVREQFTGPLLEIVKEKLTKEKMEELVNQAVKGIGNRY